ncbi:response regulator transcription factor [Sutcliffiella horikoshii]|uniref:DNA-binding response regulator n=1 Tax=Sutcliffiella horikoshii TaxID=79883 RepID=A0A1Y0CKE1_9BACI|nr:response regulator transcription factor [Sutcliffiella horikoshii]ART75397.1 DNA-binding response regulator [Sutcliffiella horikoshii]TYS54417.1 response regulator transcription factor [Sutcliffiella horikoshii]
MKNSFQILVVDDEADMREMLGMYLHNENYQVLHAENGEEAMDMLYDHEVDLIILDVMMPEMDGFTACKKIRERYMMPILMLTAKSDELDKVRGLKLGADDYVMKPFSPKELLARVEALLRRSNQAFFDVVSHREITVQKSARQVHVGGERVNLARREYDLLLFLMEHEGKVFSREQLHDVIWGLDTEKGSFRTVDTHVKTLRFKLKDAGAKIKTVWGIGYKFEAEET